MQYDKKFPINYLKTCQNAHSGIYSYNYVTLYIIQYTYTDNRYIIIM